MLLGITVSGTFLMPAGVKVPSHFYFSAMPASLLVLVDQRKILFTKNTTSGLNLLFWAPCENSDFQKLASLSSLNASNTDENGHLVLFQLIILPCDCWFLNFSVFIFMFMLPYATEHLLTLQLGDKISPSYENLSSNDSYFWPTGWQAFPLCSIQ